MIGDVNLFLSDVEEDGNNSNKRGTLCDWHHHASYAANRMSRQAEVDAMIALSSHCKRNLGAKIAFTMMHYITNPNMYCIKLYC